MDLTKGKLLSDSGKSSDDLILLDECMSAEENYNKENQLFFDRDGDSLEINPDASCAT